MPCTTRKRDAHILQYKTTKREEIHHETKSLSGAGYFIDIDWLGGWSDAGNTASASRTRTCNAGSPSVPDASLGENSPSFSHPRSAQESVSAANPHDRSPTRTPPTPAETRLVFTVR